MGKRGRPSTAVPCPQLRAYREERGLTITDAAASFGWTRPRWSGWERDGSAPARELKRVAKAWGLQLEDLEQDAEPEPGPELELQDAIEEARTALDRLSAALGRFS